MNTIDISTEEKKKYMLDGLHPGPEGHRLYAEYVISKIKARK